MALTMKCKLSDAIEKLETRRILQGKRNKWKRGQYDSIAIGWLESATRRVVASLGEARGKSDI